MRKSFKALIATSLLLLTLGGCNTEKEYPKEKAINIIIPKAPGGGTDLSTRGLIQYLKPNLDNADLVPVNRPDGGGVTGMVEVAKSKADGYTLGMVTVELGMFPHQGKCPVTYADFTPIGATIAAPATLIVPSDAPYNTVEEFVNYAKNNPNTIQVGNSGMGAIWHLGAKAFEEAYGVQLKHIPYPNGSADIAAALAGGHIQAAIADPSSYKSLYEAGKVKMLASMSEERSTIYPNVPTFKELGKNLTIRAWAVLVAPKDTPKEIIEKLRVAFKKTNENPEYRNYIIKQGVDPVNLVGEDVAKMMKEDHEFYKAQLSK